MLFTFRDPVVYVMLFGLLVECSTAKADGVINVTPTWVQGDNALQNIPTLCLYDGIGDPLHSVSITWSSSPGYNGFVTINGQTGSGTLPNTGSNGCVTITSISSGGIPPTGGTYDPVVSFSAYPQAIPGVHYIGTLELRVIPMTLSANPNALYGNQTNQPVQVTLQNAGGGTASGIAIHAGCQGTNGLVASITPSSANTSGSGSSASATFRVTVTGSEIAVPGGQAPSGSCTFSVQPNGPTLQVPLNGTNVCLLTQLSPPDPRCGNPPN